MYADHYLYQFPLLYRKTFSIFRDYKSYSLVSGSIIRIIFNNACAFSNCDQYYAAQSLLICTQLSRFSFAFRSVDTFRDVVQFLNYLKDYVALLWNDSSNFLQALDTMRKLKTRSHLRTSYVNVNRTPVLAFTPLSTRYSVLYSIIQIISNFSELWLGKKLVRVYLSVSRTHSKPAYSFPE